MSESEALDRSTAEAIAVLGYSRIWLDAGLLNRDELLMQRARFAVAMAPVEAGCDEKSAFDRHPEHFRWATLSTFLALHSAIRDDQVGAILKIAETDPDATSDAGFPISLLRHNGLTDAQFERVAESRALATFPRVVLRFRCLRRLGRGEWSPELVDMCLRADGPAQAALLESPALTKAAAEMVAARGFNKGVRNRAAELLKGKRLS
jgi:hypothetical protein